MARVCWSCLTPESIFGPLDMRDTCWDIDARPDLLARRGILHGWTEGSTEFTQREWPGL